jgi:penicillin-binding protein 1A
MVGGLDYEDNQFNRAVHAHRQPGSSFKLYVYATGFENGMNPRSIVRDYGGHCGNWSPKNYSGGSSGRSMAAIDAFRQSLNIPAVNVSLQVGREKVLEMTQRLGVEGVRKTCSMALGDTGIAPLQHTGAYATFANDGKLTRPYAVLELYNSKGDLIYARDRDEPEPPQVISRRVAEQMNQMMRAVVTDGTGKRAELGFTTAIGKSGTSSSYRDAWFMGITGALVAGVWVGYDDFRPMPGITGGSLPAQIWHNFMSVALGGYSTIPPIPGIGGHGTEMADARGGDAKRADSQAQGAQATAQANASVSGGAKKTSLMSDQARDTLRRLAQSLRRAAGVEATPVEHGPAAAKPKPPEGKPAPATPERRAEAPELRVPRP